MHGASGGGTIIHINRGKPMSRTQKILLILAVVLAATLTVPLTVSARNDSTALPESLVTLCHRPGTKHQETMTLTQSRAKRHFKHGDRVGQCVVPVPAIAFGPAIDPAKGYLVEEIEDGVYWVTEGAYTMMFVTTGVGVIVVDAPPTIGANILNAISDVTDEPITHVIYSHSHADHIGAASMYPEDATYIAHEATLEQLQRDRPFPFGIFAGGGPVPLPDVTFDSNFTLEVGDKTLELEYRGLNHDAGNLYIYAPDQKVLMLVDVIFPGWTPFKNFALAEDVFGYIAAHEEVLSFDFDAMVAGHLGRLATREDVEIQQEYVLDIQANAAQALQTVDFFGIAQQTGFENAWLLFDTYLDAVAQKCADLTLEKWLGELGAADVFTFDHCWVMMESLRID